MKRYLQSQIEKDLAKKMVFLGGPRQVGKTTLALQFAARDSYLNWDDAEDRERILRRRYPESSIWIFDEIHKYKNWRNLLKGLYDKNKDIRRILVTGSARLDLIRRGGDSLQGRYHFLRLHPLTLDELGSTAQSDLKALLELGGFPEPFLGGEKFEAQRWSREYRQRILRDDIISVESIENLGAAEHLMICLPDLVAGPLSLNSLREDIQVSHKTLKRWIEIFERFYAIYRLAPFGSPRIKAAKKEQKHYHYDWTLVTEPGPRFENLCANHLLKWCHFYEDTQGRDLELRYFKDNEQREVDFVVTENRLPLLFVESKWNDKMISPHLKYLKRKFPQVASYQILFESRQDFVSDLGIRLGPACKLLEEIKARIAKPIPPIPAGARIS
jgi:predicted AAA+ superfamily ATPase